MSLSDDNLPPLPKAVKNGYMDCEDCDGRGTDGEPRYQGEFQPPEADPCGSCHGSGRWKAELYTADQMRTYAKAAIAAAAQGQEPVGWVCPIDLNAMRQGADEGSWYVTAEKRPDCSTTEPLYTSPPPATEQDALDSRRYRWLREQDWFASPLCVLRNPKQTLTRGSGLGADCPSRDRLDDALDAAIAATKERK